MSTTPQSYANHTRWQPVFHFFVLPVLLINVIWTIVYTVRYPTWTGHWLIVVSVALVLLAVFSRTNSLKVQDRIIRLEEQLRYQQLLPAELAQRASSLTMGQIVALRFADDQELGGLVSEVLTGKLSTRKEIKQAIKRWRADEFRV
jgi:Family of unknown function (DUF6526)